MNCFRLLQLLLTIKTASAMRLHILTEDSHILTRSGQTLTLPCVAKGKNFDPFSNPVIWYKVAHNGEEFQINTGAVISTPFVETGRYKVDPQLDFSPISTVIMPLSIKNLTLTENGTYRCELRSRSKVLASIIHQVDIFGPITKLELTSPNQNSNNKTKMGMEKFVFYENEPSTVTCDFVGSGPPPVIHVIRGDVDITPLFVRTESVKLIGEPGLQYAMYHIEYKSTKLKMEKEHNGKTLYCTAQKPTFTELSQTKIAAINVLYAAQFSCDTELLATVGEVDLEIFCRITANPPVEVNNVWWTFSRREWNLTNGQSRDEFSSHIVLKDGAVLATLTIANVSNSSFQTYELTAQTKLAKRQHAIILEEEIPTTLAPTTTSTTVRTTTTPPTTTSITASSPIVTKSTTKSSMSADMKTITSTVTLITAKPVQAQTISSISTPDTSSNVPTTSLSTPHKRRKHGKHKHKGKKKQRGQQSSSKGLKPTTVSTFTANTKLIKVQEPTQISRHKNKTSENKTVDKHDTPSDVQYTIIDEPVKLNNASSALRLHITSYFGFILFVLCAVLTL